MARIRTIKPEFWTDETLVECSMSSRLLLIGMLNFADDNGNLPRSSKKIKMQIFPAETIDCETLILELIAHGVLTEYSVDSNTYLHINGYKDQNSSIYQVINRPSKCTIPPINQEKSNPCLPDDIPKNNDDTETLHEDSVTEGKRSRSGKEGKGREAEKPRAEFLKIIQAFDDCRAEVFGEEHRRPYPAPDDADYAKRFSEAGYSLDDCREVFKNRLLACLAAKKRPIDRLGYFDKPLEDFFRGKLARNTNPMAKKPPDKKPPRGRSTKDPEYLKSLEDDEP